MTNVIFKKAIRNLPKKMESRHVWNLLVNQTSQRKKSIAIFFFQISVSKTFDSKVANVVFIYSFALNLSHF